MSQPALASQRRVASSSTPSAVMVAPSSCAMAMVAVMMAWSEREVSSEVTNERSIFSSSGASRRRLTSDECPVPKSSSEIRMPCARSCGRASATRSGSRMASVSVISSISPGPDSRWALRMSATRPGSARSLAEILTERQSGGSDCGHRRRCSRPLRSRCRFIGPATRACSASCTKSSGSIGPWVGWSQRTSSSAPVQRPLRRSSLGCST